MRLWRLKYFVIRLIMSSPTQWVRRVFVNYAINTTNGVFCRAIPPICLMLGLSLQNYTPAARLFMFGMAARQIVIMHRGMCRLTSRPMFTWSVTDFQHLTQFALLHSRCVVSLSLPHKPPNVFQTSMVAVQLRHIGRAVPSQRHAYVLRHAIKRQQVVRGVPKIVNRGGAEPGCCFFVCFVV